MVALLPAAPGTAAAGRSADRAPPTPRRDTPPEAERIRRATGRAFPSPLPESLCRGGDAGRKDGTPEPQPRPGGPPGREAPPWPQAAQARPADLSPAGFRPAQGAAALPH